MVRDRGHVAAPSIEILVGGAAHLRERATTPCVGEPGVGTVGQIIEPRLPWLPALIYVRLERLEIREGDSRAWMFDSADNRVYRDSGLRRGVYRDSGLRRGVYRDSGRRRGASGDNGSLGSISRLGIFISRLSTATL
ncbi:hypothetical protein H010_03012 [Hydrogenophaga taeniospiralis CCUG 15921]|uniref:Uncharacterized protein n=1 Tax=Hydrogenophaga taeniospiralis CCUG 15921 TaxID=1281780 RepID=A0A9X4NTR5_9BURK|nr:hypothetical protein [Hydrogenophaga taeniospiralis CCUG 15921]